MSCYFRQSKTSYLVLANAKTLFKHAFFGRDRFAAWRCMSSGELRTKIRLALVFIVLSPLVTESRAVAAKDSSIRYAYILADVKQGSDPVCTHMKHVFNRDFSKLWNAEPLWSNDDARYAVDSRYAFPRVLGIEHSGRATFNMRFSKVPSSQEFDAIPWKEGRATIGAGAGAAPQPILVAYVDFDDDGQLDTVIKMGFNNGYSYTTFGGNLFAEHLLVFRGRQLGAEEIVSLNPLVRDVSPTEAPIIVTATYERPFIYQGHTYVARYDEDLGDEFNAGTKSPYKPLSETMSVISYRFSGQTESSSGAPKWDETIICRFSMSQISQQQ